MPGAEERMHTTNGLLRDPVREQAVIDFYRKFHQNTTDVVLYFAGMTKEATQRQIVTGTFFAYVMENVCIQEAGYLAPEKLLESKDIDYIASPYTYENGNIPGKARWESDLVDDAGNWLGRARGVGGDGGYRVLLESVRRCKKLYIAEIDPSTYLEPEKTTEGGSGFDTVDGTLHILRRDLSQVFTQGNGGWLFEFGHVPTFKAKKGWYDDKPMIDEIRTWADLGHKSRARFDTRSIADIAARPDVAVIFPVHPNPNVRPIMDAVLGGLPNVAMIEPLDYPHFVRLLDLCTLVLTDSGGVQEEAPSLGKPVLVMRETTERPEGVEAGTAKLVGTDRALIVREVLELLDDKDVYDAMARAHNPFGDGHAAERIAGVIAG